MLVPGHEAAMVLLTASAVRWGREGGRRCGLRHDGVLALGAVAAEEELLAGNELLAGEITKVRHGDRGGEGFGRNFGVGEDMVLMMGV